MTPIEILKKFGPYLIALAIGIGVGWSVKPDVHTTSVVEKVVEVEKKDGRLDELLVQISKLNRDYQEMKNSKVQERYHKERLETKLPDGTVTIKETEDKNVDSVVQETRKEVEVRVVEVEKQVVVTQTVTVEKLVEKEKIVTAAQAQWHVGVLAGISPQFLPTIKLDTVVIGGEVERRIVGPMFLGVWGAGTTTGVGMGGIKAGFEF